MFATSSVQNHGAYDENSAPPSMTDLLLQPLDQLQNISQTLFRSLGPPQSKPPPPPSIASFLAVDAELAAAVQLTRVHQVKQRHIEQIKDEVLELDRRWREIVRELEQGRRELEEMVQEGEERIKAIHEAKAGKPEHLIYSHCLNAIGCQLPSHIPSFSHMHKVYPHSLRHRLICPISHCLGSLLHLYSSLHSLTKRRCAAAT